MEIPVMNPHHMTAPKAKRQRLVFSEKLMFSFINDYKENAVLWDIRHPDYKCSEKRKAALAKLAAKYDLTEEEARKKLASLRSTYLQEKKKVEESKKSGGPVYEPSLYWFRKLEFLYDVIIPRKAVFIDPLAPPSPDKCQVIQVPKDQTSENEEVGEEHLIFEFIPDDNEQPSCTPKPEHSYSIQPAVRKFEVKKRPKRISGLPVLKQPAMPLHQPSQQQHATDYLEAQPLRLQPQERSCHSPQPPTPMQEDEFDKFCSSIASQLRTLPPADAIEMQLEIQQLVSRRRLAVLKSQLNQSIFRTWENNADGYNQQQQVDSDSGQEDQSDKFIIGQ